MKLTLLIRINGWGLLTIESWGGLDLTAAGRLLLGLHSVGAVLTQPELYVYKLPPAVH